MGDASEGGSANVDVSFGFDLAGAADDGGEVLTEDFAGGDFSDVGLTMNDAACNDACQNQYSYNNNDDLFRAHPDAPFFHVRWGAERYFPAVMTYPIDNTQEEVEAFHRIAAVPALCGGTGGMFLFSVRLMMRMISGSVVSVACIARPTVIQ